MSAAEFAGEFALVTGASSGVRSGVAKRLARGGATVAVHYHSHLANAATVVAEIEAAGGAAFAVGGDVSNPEAATALVAAFVA
jgi:NAD(P)-dependent dehydrogenase (short-subunit alcohol dehydrogenase family)